ncbi:NADH dehydrogenase (ubiquinone) 1 alpha subcomplex subunit 13, partial [Tremellales sp. Uapishka_1]
MSHGFKQSVSVSLLTCLHYLRKCSRDMPPAGGYEAIKYKRNLPIRGPGGILVFGTMTAICAYGFWRIGEGNLEKRELQREKAWSRIHLVPLIMAEQDRDAYRRNTAALAREKEIMKDVEGWEVGKSAYHTARYTPNTIVVL